MALIIRGKSCCSICGKVLEVGQSLQAFPAFIGDTLDPLWRYSDSAMHEDCFLSWERRDLMISKYRRAMGEVVDEPEQPKTRMAVIGSPDERASYIEHLRGATESSTPLANSE